MNGPPHIDCIHVYIVPHKHIKTTQQEWESYVPLRTADIGKIADAILLQINRMSYNPEQRWLWGQHQAQPRTTWERCRPQLFMAWSNDLNAAYNYIGQIVQMNGLPFGFKWNEQYYEFGANVQSQWWSINPLGLH